MRLKNKVAIVTGAADGIGLAISEAYVKEGAIVFAADINEKKCITEAERMSLQGAIVRAVKCDVGITDDVDRLIDSVVKEFERIDILVNNAAVAISGKITDMPEEDWDVLMNVNLKSIYRTIKAALPYMIKQRSGSVINLSSTQAFRSWNNWTAYAGAKGAILSITRQLAGQFGECNVRFNSISPGAILTPLNENRAKKEGPGFFDKSAAMHAIKRL